ncbi:MAG: tetratricopeptide repeat protein [Deltaproteobacteria bacterium]|nr:tetratricopeptide repeat protein [Deltaproteobacteria bacterium]
MRSIIRLVTLCVLIMCSTSLAHAEKPSAKKLFRQAETHYQESRFLDALDLYKQAYKRRPLAGFFINIGQCYRQLFRWREALAAYEKYLELTPKGVHRARAKKLIALCQKELKRIAKIRARKEKRAKPTPVKPADVKPADVKPADVKPAGPVKLAVATKPSPMVPAVEPATSMPSDDQSKAHAGLSKMFFWSGVALSTAFVATGIVTGVMALGKSDEYNDPTTETVDLQDLRDSGEALATTSNITLAVGLVAAAGTVALFFFTDWGGVEERDDEITVGVAPTFGGALFGLQGRF